MQHRDITDTTLQLGTSPNRIATLTFLTKKALADWWKFLLQYNTISTIMFPA